MPEPDVALKDLSYLDIQPLLVRLANLDRSLVLVGGQAVGFWSWKYRARRPELRRQAPIASKDLDFCGDRRVVRICAERIGGEMQFPDLDNVTTPNSGVVFFNDADGIRRRIDILGRLYGVDASAVQKTSVEVDITDEHGVSSGRRFCVMHPVLVLESRVANVAGLPNQYNNPKGLEQLRLSIVCAREFMRDVLDRTVAVENPERAVLRLNERIARFCVENEHARHVYAKHGIDPADALLVDDRLPAAFLSQRLPQLQRQLADRSRKRNLGRGDDDLDR